MTIPITPRNVESFRPDRLWSLWDVINASVTGLAPLIHQLVFYQQQIEKHADEAGDDVREDMAKKMQGWLGIADPIARDFEMTAALDRVERFKKRLAKRMTYRDLGAECRVLYEAVESGLKNQLIYRYPDAMKAELETCQDDWKATLEKFPSSRPDVAAAVDCWALGHGTAAVFHLMRVLEHGLRALAADVGKNFDVQSWQVVINEIESEIRAQGKSLPPGLPKSERLRFLAEAAKEFVYFKDGWRNYVSHNRATYDVHQARSVLEHVRTFMTVLSSRLGEVDETSEPQP